jgi:hypothetical protein
VEPSSPSASSVADMRRTFQRVRPRDQLSGRTVWETAARWARSKLMAGASLPVRRS